MARRLYLRAVRGDAESSLFSTPPTQNPVGLTPRVGSTPISSTIFNQLQPPVLLNSLPEAGGLNPSVETNSLGTLAVLIQPSFYLLAGDGVWGRGRRLSLLRFIGNAPRPLPTILIPHP